MASSSIAIPNPETLKKIVRRAKFDPDWFCKEILRSPNDIWQSEMLNAMADLDRIREGLPTLFNHEGKNRFTTRAFHGPGKTHYLSKLGHWWNFTRKGRIVATAPKEKQLTNRLWPEFRKILSGAIPEYREFITTTKTTIEWFGDEDWCAIAETASNPENLAGHHAEWLLFLIEEASGVREEMFPAIEGALSTPGSALAMIGNPTRTVGEFYNSHNKRGTMELYYRKAIQHHETPRITKQWVDGMISKYGLNSPVVQVRVFGNFVDTMENQLIALPWVQDAIDREFYEDGSMPSFRVSVDVADGGEDSSVVSVAYLYESFIYLVKQHKFNFPPSLAPIETAQAAARIFDQLQEDRPELVGDIVVDSIGVGAGTAGWLMQEHYPVIAYKGGESSDDTRQWTNRRTQSYLCYRNDLRDGRVIIADNYYQADEEDDFLAQHASIKTKPGSERVEDLETKQEMRRQGIKSPDMVDAIVMHYATQSPTIGAGSGSDFLQTTSALTSNQDW
jgi:phage terminase large subunit